MLINGASLFYLAAPHAPPTTQLHFAERSPNLLLLLASQAVLSFFLAFAKKPKRWTRESSRRQFLSTANTPRRKSFRKCCNMRSSQKGLGRRLLLPDPWEKSWGLLFLGANSVCSPLVGSDGLVLVSSESFNSRASSATLRYLFQRRICWHKSSTCFCCSLLGISPDGCTPANSSYSATTSRTSCQCKAPTADQLLPQL